MLDIVKFENIFKDYYADLVRYAHGFLAEFDACEEVVQNLFVRLWEGREDLKVQDSYRAYLYSATRNACLNEIKHEKVKREYTAHQTHQYNNERSDYFDSLETSELGSEIEQAIDRLPEGRRKIFRLSRLEGLKYKEIAEKLDISIKTVENQMGSAMKQLREDLKAHIMVIILLIISSF
jgi:RNA polymerase sigma-70 factor (ECF subfamily)